MKLIMAIVHKEDEHKVVSELGKNGFSTTKLCSSGGFLRSGNVTLLVGVDDDKVDSVIQVIEKKSKSRKIITDPSIAFEAYTNYPIEIEVGGATIFVLNVERFEKV